MIEIDPSAIVSENADIQDSVKGSRIIVGPGSVIDSFVKILPAGGTGDIVIGERCYINSGVVIYSGNGVKIGNNVLIAANCTLASSNHEYKSRHKTIFEQRFKESKGGIIIEDDVWIGANSVLLDGVVIRKGAVIGTMSLARGELEEYGIYAGNPIELIGRRE